MGWFGNGHGERVAELERQVSALTARVVKAEATAADCAERAYRYMKKAESRARRELDGTAEASGAGAAPATPAAATTSSQRARVPWGARGRRLMSMLRGDPLHGAEFKERQANGDGEE